MEKRKVISKGYTIEVTSWENDGDNYNTEKIVEQNLDKAKAIGKMCEDLFASTNSAKKGIGNTNEGSEGRAQEKIVDYMRNNPILCDNKELTDGKLISICMNYNHDLMGGSEYYYSRVCESVTITYSPEDVYLEEISF